MGSIWYLHVFLVVDYAICKLAGVRDIQVICGTPARLFEIGISWPGSITISFLFCSISEEKRDESGQLLARAHD